VTSGHCAVRRQVRSRGQDQSNGDECVIQFSHANLGGVTQLDVGIMVGVAQRGKVVGMRLRGEVKGSHVYRHGVAACEKS